MVLRYGYLFLLFSALHATTGQTPLPTLPDAVRLFQLDSMNKLKEAVREQEGIIAENQAKIAELEADSVSKDELIASTTAENNRFQQTVREQENIIAENRGRIAGLEAANARKGEVIADITARNNQLAKDIVDGRKKCKEEKSQCETTVVYMVDVMLHNNKVMEENQNLLEAQANTIREATEEIRRQRNSSLICEAASSSTAPQANTITLLRSSLASALEFRELSTAGLDNLTVAPFMSELIESYNDQTKIIADLKGVIRNVKADNVSNMARQMAHLASAMSSPSVNLDIVDQQARLIEKQGESITKLTPLLRRASADITWNKKAEVGDDSVQSVESCSCLPRSMDSIWPRPTGIEYSCGDQSDRYFRIPCIGGVCKTPEFDWPSCTGSPDLKWDWNWEKFTSAGVVSSPNYPNDYSNSYSRTQTISAPAGMKVEMVITDFTTESNFDFLTIRDGDGTTLMARTSGPKSNVRNTTLKSRTNTVHLDFVTDSSATYSGWSVKWWTK